MKVRIVIPLAFIGLFSVGNAYALTNTQAEILGIGAATGNSMDLSKLEAAAKAGDIAAQKWLATYWDTKKDYVKAIFWYRKTAAQGNSWAENKLGLAYSNGQGLPQSYAKANYWYEKAAAQR
ncbi:MULTISPECIES: tetratricopeptide repeat protein [unclassified Acidithiobacillus]|uniref:tetratricopeptide repeat protein n=1 Tax=unclassified Acidithiobacillus TaxID=2614800 RepID=UPI001D0D353B|nr:MULTISPECIES: hypothetical protein [unclassified Acidithiobacillus]